MAQEAVSTQADQNGNGELLQPLGHLGRVVARIKDEQRDRLGRRRSADESRDLDRLPSGVAGGVVIKATVWARLGIATGPDAQINSVDRLILRRRVPR
jgi:hypothetical protein